MISSLAVFCGSKNGNDPLFTAHAAVLGQMLAERNILLVYGGSSKGLMGAVANSCLDAGGKVLGVIPEVLMGWEQHHLGLTELKIVEDMHVRKKLLYDKCDAAIVLPGGFGTLDELFEMVTWNQLSIHDKKIFLLNSNGFYDSLLLHAKRMEQEGFLYEKLEERIVVIDTPQEFIGLL